MRSFRISAFAFWVGAVFAGPLDAANFTVRALFNNTFVPSNLTIEVGDSVTFINVGNGLHNVLEDNGAWACAEGCEDQGGSGEPSSSSWSFTRVFEVPGDVGYYCDVHGVPGSGMIGKIRVVVPNSPGALEWSAATYVADEGRPTVTALVRRVGGISGAVSIRATASAGTASAADFTPSTATLHWAEGDTATKTFTVSLRDDALAEPTETILLALSNPSGGATLGPRATATITLEDDDAPPSPGKLLFSAPAFLGNEGGAAVFGVERIDGLLGSVSVAYSTSDGTATAGADYPSTQGSVSFAAGESGIKTVTIPLAADNVVEGAESFAIALANPTGGAVLAAPNSAVISIAETPNVVGALSASQVACDAARLVSFLERSRVISSPSARVPQLALTFSGLGDFAGIASRGGVAPEAESLLGFSSNGEETTLLRNPARLQLFSVSLTRNDLNSDLVAASSPDVLRVEVNPTLDLTNPEPAGLLLIDNLLGTAGRGADAKPGRGLAEVLATCHPPFGARDVHLFRLLAKIARGEAVGAQSVELAIYRAATPANYRLDVFPIEENGSIRGRFSVNVSVTETETGELLAGQLRALPACANGQTMDCSTLQNGVALALFRPVATGAPPPTTVRVAPSGPNEVTVDWTALLAGTTWRRPL